MFDTSDPEDRRIRAILLAAAVAAVAGVLAAATTVAVMVSLNFNFLDWME
jgi:ABC-type branched-subunit amino acid transport system permease subunit